MQTFPAPHRSRAFRAALMLCLFLAAAVPTSAAEGARPKQTTPRQVPDGKVPAGIRPDGTLDRDLVHYMYMEGEFDKVQAALEHYRHSVDSLSDPDRIVVYKYLGVIYSARPETRVKGEGYLFSLLQIVPTITLLDMYISDAVESIFKNVQERYKTVTRERQDSGAPATAAAAETPPTGSRGAPRTPAARPARKGSAKWPYIAAAGAATAAAAVAFFVLSGPAEPEREAYTLGRP